METLHLQDMHNFLPCGAMILNQFCSLEHMVVWITFVVGIVILEDGKYKVRYSSEKSKDKESINICC